MQKLRMSKSKTYCHSYGWKRSQSAYIGGRNQYIDSGKKDAETEALKSEYEKNLHRWNHRWS